MKNVLPKGMNTKGDNFSVKQRVSSLKYAFEGFRILIKSEHNARVHLTIAILVVVLGFVLKIEGWEWALVVFAIGFVFVAEIFNTCIERICDFVCTENNILIKKIKDLAAFAVLLSVICAVIVGLIIFLPKLL